ncbi:MAG: hypothetical protein Sylvanvirus9_17 [Sylvanvirus sp.]|uniref:Uncharacterized protein n=1 Tax=Sylvanvirus sp. TaxID=2487774 RepID=A0A3G5AHV7_9VIRU|nr:MAG: hypothetical protein Sylvanvirus9_17 [Sylvanvirus sp.]
MSCFRIIILLLFLISAFIPIPSLSSSDSSDSTNLSKNQLSINGLSKAITNLDGDVESLKSHLYLVESKMDALQSSFESHKSLVELKFETSASKLGHMESSLNLHQQSMVNRFETFQFKIETILQSNFNLISAKLDSMDQRVQNFSEYCFLPWTLMGLSWIVFWALGIISGLIWNEAVTYRCEAFLQFFSNNIKPQRRLTSLNSTNPNSSISSGI